MSQLTARWGDDHVAAFADKIAELGRRFPKVLPRIVNQVGNRAKTQVIRNLTRQTGLPRKTIVRAIGKPATARPSRLAYEMTTQGGNIRLKYVKPKETRAGVRASPWGKRTLFAGTFILGGRFPNRHGLVRGGHVMRRLNSAGRKLTFARSGMFIPVEMITGATATAFERTAAPLLKQRVCPRNDCVITDDARTDMNARGVYVAPGQHVRPDGKVIGNPPESWTVSFWVSGLASPFKTWGERAAEYVAAVRSGEPGEIQSVVNGGFGELWAPGGGDVPEWRELEKLKLPYLSGEVPADVRVLTAGVDVQKDRLVYAVRGWAARSESWLIEAGEVFGDTVEEATWDGLEDVLLKTRDGHAIRLALIDSGFRPGRPDAVPEHRVYQFCQKHSRFCRPIKGRDTQVKPVIPRKSEVGVNIRGRRVMIGLERLDLDTDYFKRSVHERLRWPVDEPGAFHLPQDVSDDYLRQLVSEARIRKPGGKPVWVKRARDNHYLDCEAMNAAAAFFLGVQRLRDDHRNVGASPVAMDIPVLPDRKQSMADWSAMLNR